MNKDTIALKERIIALVDGCNLPYVIPLLNDLENAIHEHSFDSGYETGYDIAESYFIDYCARLLTTHELDSFVEECIIDNGGSCFDIWCDDYYVVMDKE